MEMDLMLIDLLESSKAIGLCPMGIITIFNLIASTLHTKLFKILHPLEISVNPDQLASDEAS